MTPCEKLGYKVGDKFEVVSDGGSWCKRGDIVVLNEDDGSNCPFFHKENGGWQQRCLYLHEVKLLQPKLFKLLKVMILKCLSMK